MNKVTTFILASQVAAWEQIFQTSRITQPAQNQDATAPSEYLACGFTSSNDRNGWTGTGIAQLKMIWCHEFNWNTQQTGNVAVTQTTLTNPETHMCPENYYVQGINVKIEPESAYDYAYLKLGATFQAGTFYSYGVEDACPQLWRSGCAYHNDCDSNSNNQEWIQFTMPENKVWEVSQVFFQKRGDGGSQSQHLQSFWVNYLDSQNQWITAHGWRNIGMTSNTEYDDLHTHDFNPPLLAKIVRINLLSVDHHVGGRFDVKIRKYRPSINQIEMKCTSRTSDSLNSIIRSSKKTGTWQTMISSSTSFVNGVQVMKAATTDTFNLGFYGMKLTFLELTCKYELIAASTQRPITKFVNPADDDDTSYDGTLVSYSIFSDYLINTNVLRCPHSSCKLLLNCNEQELIPTSPQPFEVKLIPANDTFQVNTDPIWEFDRSICVQCSNKYGKVNSLSFNVKLECPGDIKIWQPLDLVNQTYDATPDASQKPTFKFKSFRSQTSACQNYQYSIFQSQNLLKLPIGIALENPILDQITDGQTNNKEFSFSVSDWMKPFKYTFQIQSIAIPSNIFYSTMFALTVKCPNAISFSLAGIYVYYQQSYIGATGTDAQYSFPMSVSSLPMCTDISEYQTIEVSPPGTVSFDQNCPDKCRQLVFDVSVARTITFKIQPKDTMSLALPSDLITIEIFESYRSPTLQNYNFGLGTGQTDQSQTVYLGSTTKFTFYPFTCSSGCVVSNYQISSSNSQVTKPLTGILSDPTLNPETNVMEIDVDSTLLTGSSPYKFFIRAELQESPTIFAFSNELSLSVTCGLETVSVSQPASVEFPLLPRVLGSKIDKTFQSQNIQSMFISSQSQCPLVKFELFASQLDDAWSDESMQLLNGNDWSNAALRIDQSSPFKKRVYLKASTATGASNRIIINQTVCGNEEVTAVVQQSEPHHILFPGDSFKMSLDQQHQCFGTSYKNENCASECTEIQLSIWMGSACDQSPTYFNKDQAGDIVVDTSSSYVQYLCLQAQTQGLKTATSKIKFTVCGEEIVSLKKLIDKSQIEKKIYARKSPTNSINITVEGFQFQSSNPDNCPVTDINLVRKEASGSYILYTDSLVTYKNGSLNFKTDDPFETEILYVRANSKAALSFGYLPFQIKVCGSETLIVKEKAISKTFSKQLSLQTIKGFQQFFSNSDPDECPIDEYKLEYRNNKTLYERNDLLAIDLNENKILIYPSKFGEKEKEETLQLYLVATTIGLSEAKHEITLNLLSGKISDALVIHEPQFNQDLQQKQKIDVSYEESSIFYFIKFPKIVSPIDLDIKPIDIGEAVFKRGKSFDDITEVINRPIWLEFKSTNTKNHYQYVHIGHRNFANGNIAILRMEPNDCDGFYSMEFKIKDEMDHFTEYVLLFRIDVRKIEQETDFSDFESLRQKDFDVGLVLREPCRKLINIYFFRPFYFGEDPVEKFIFDNNIMPSIVFDKDHNKMDENLLDIEDASLVKCFFKMSGAVLVDMVMQAREESFTAQEQISLALKIMSTSFAAEIHGIKWMNGQECHQTVKFEVEDSAKDIIEDLILENKAFAAAAVQGIKNENIKVEVEEEGEVIETQMEKKLDLVLIGGEVFLKIRFDRELVRLSSSEIFDVDSLVFQIFAISAIDNSEIEGDWVIKNNYHQEQHANSIDSRLYARQLAFNVSYYNQDETWMNLKLSFKNKEQVSSTSYGQDKIGFLMRNNSLIRGVDNAKMSDDSYENLKFVRIPPLPRNPEREKEMQESLENAQMLMYILQINLIIYQIFLSKSLQDLWAMLNTQAITIHLMIFTCSQTVPSNLLAFNTQMSEVTQKDMYPTDLIYGFIFNFTEKDSPYENFEFLGYEGANFIELSGSAIINIVLGFVTYIFFHMVNRICMSFYTKQWARQLGTKIEKTSFSHVLITFYLQGFLELLICAVVSIQELTSEDFVGGNFSDLFAAIFVIFSALSLGILPFYMFRVLWRDFHNIESPEFQEKYGFMIEDLSVQTFSQAIFHIIYLIRRALFVFILVYFDGYNGLQLCLHLQLTTFYMLYINHIQPYSNSYANQWEVFNECCVMFVSYTLMFLQSVYLTPTDKHYVGYFQILVYCINLFFNISKILTKMIYESIPEMYRAYKQKKLDKMHEKMFEKWVEDKQKFCKENPRAPLVDKMGELTQVMREIRAMKGVIVMEEQRIDEQRNWLQQHQLDVKVLKPEVDELNNRISQINSLHKREAKLNKKLKQEFDRLKAHTVQDTIDSLLRPTMETFIRNYNERREVIERHKAKKRAVRDMKKAQKAKRLEEERQARVEKQLKEKDERRRKRENQSKITKREGKRNDDRMLIRDDEYVFDETPRFKKKK